jgi:RNA polymerase sigma factor (TIGR02999 family)
MNEVTRILSAIQDGDGEAPAQLLPLVYQELRELAAERYRHEKPGYSMQATALVHEAYLRLVDRDQPQQFNGRGHFFAAAAEAMRRILVERARRRQRVRHGGGRQRLDLTQLDSAQLVLANDCDVADDVGGAEELLALDEALARLAAHDPQAAEVVKLRYFAGLTAGQAADALDISLRTANRHWAYAKAWLYQQLSEHRSEAGDPAHG